MSAFTCSKCQQEIKPGDNVIPISLDEDIRITTDVTTMFVHAECTAVPASFDVVSAELTSTPYAANDKRPDVQFAYFSTLAQASDYAAGEDVFVLDRATGIWSLRVSDEDDDWWEVEYSIYGYEDYHHVEVMGDDEQDARRQAALAIKRTDVTIDSVRKI